MGVGAEPANVNAVPSRLVRRPERKRLRGEVVRGMGGYLSKKEIQRAGVAVKASKRGYIGRGGAVKFI